MNAFVRTLSLLGLTLAGALGAAQASTRINQTRVIYPAGEREVSVSVQNDDGSARLLQAWVDGGDANETPETTRAPFLITPPMSRVDPGKGQTFRLMFTGAHVPQDRESVFWLNVLEIPPKPKADSGSGDSQNFLQFAVRTRIKIFYRPKGLPGNPVEAVDKLTWEVSKHGGAYVAECVNNSPFNVSLATVKFKNAPETQSFGNSGGMCPAMGKGQFDLASGSPEAAQDKLSITSVNDYGGLVPHEAGFSR